MRNHEGIHKNGTTGFALKGSESSMSKQSVKVNLLHLCVLSHE